MQEYDSSALKFDLEGMIDNAMKADALPSVPSLDDSTVPMVDLSPQSRRQPETTTQASPVDEIDFPEGTDSEPSTYTPDVPLPDGEREDPITLDLPSLDDVDQPAPFTMTDYSAFDSQPHAQDSTEVVPAPAAPQTFNEDDFSLPIPASMPEPVAMADWQAPEPMDDSGLSDPFVMPFDRQQAPANETTYNVTVESPDEMKMFDEVVDRMGPELDRRDRSIGFTVEEALDHSLHLMDRRNRF